MNNIQCKHKQIEYINKKKFEIFFKIFKKYHNGHRPLRIVK